MIRSAKKKVIALIGVAVGVWIATPIPEVSIIIGAISGHTVTSFLGFPPYTRWVGALAGVPVGWLFLHETGLIDRIERFFGLEENEFGIGD